MAICTVGGRMDGCEAVLLSLHYRGSPLVLVPRVDGSDTDTNPTDRSGRRSAAHVHTVRPAVASQLCQTVRSAL